MAYAAPVISPTDQGVKQADKDSSSDEDTSATESVAPLSAKPYPEAWDPHRYLLLLRFAILNLVGFGLLGAAYAHGFVHRAFAADRTHLAVVIFFVFVAGLALCAWKVWQTSRELNDLRSFDPDSPSSATEYVASMLHRDAESRSNLTSALRMKLSYRISVIRNIANSLVILGLIGTVLGFIIALSGVDPENASDVSAISPMVATLIDGMSTALYTTLVGAVLNVWLMANHQLLAGGTVKLIAGLVVLAENHARD